MKTNTKFTLLASFAVLVLIAAYQFAYQRGFTQGYSKGVKDEYVLWKQEPVSVRSWNGILTGRRNLNVNLLAKPVPQVVRPPIFEFDKNTGKVVRKG